MARQQLAQVRRLGQGPQPLQRVEIVAQAAVVGDDRGAPAEHRVPGQHHAVGRDLQADRVGRVPRRDDDAQLAAGAVQHVTGGQALAAQPVRRVDRAHRRAGQLGQPRRARRVILVPVRQHDVGDTLAALGGDRADALQVPLVGGPRVDHDRRRRPRLGDQPGVRPVERHQRRVRRQDAPGPAAARSVDRVAAAAATLAGVRRHAAPSRGRRELAEARHRQPHRALPQLDLGNDRGHLHAGRLAPSPRRRRQLAPTASPRWAGTAVISPRSQSCRAFAGVTHATSDASPPTSLVRWPAGSAAAKNRVSNRRGSTTGVIHRDHGRSRSARSTRSARPSSSASDTDRSSSAWRSASNASLVVSATTESADSPASSDPGLLEGLPDRSADQRPGLRGRRVEDPAPLGRVGPGPGHLLVGVPGVDRSAGKHEGSGRERHRRLTAQHVDLKAGAAGPEQHDGRRVARLRRRPAPRTRSPWRTSPSSPGIRMEAAFTASSATLPPARRASP